MMKAAEYLRGNVSYITLEPLVSSCLSEDSSASLDDLDQLREVVAYLDCTYFILRHLSNVLKRTASNAVPKPAVFYENVLAVMDLLLVPENRPTGILGEPVQPKSDLARHTKVSYLRHLFTQVWVHFLDNPLPDSLMLKALRLLGDGRMNRLGDVRLLSDYVIPIFDPEAAAADVKECSKPTDQDLVVPPTWSRAVSRTVLHLVVQGGLNYPRLYPRLYQLLDDSLLVCPETERFLDDLDTYLRSLLLSTNVVAAFVKRLSQLALLSPLRLTCALLSMIHDCILRHPKCAVLVNRRKRPHSNKRVRPTEHNSVDSANSLADAASPQTSDPAILSKGDPYQWDPHNLEKSKALDSSLWEVASLIHHYSDDVATLAYKICHPNPVDAPGVASPSEIIRQKDEELKADAESVRQNLIALTQSNAQFPNLPPLEGWVF
ncbi:unnamed protein product [Calicophoron daubneyi]|uniref:CCAAT-binding factor domain-containing protein n=1 Tax=Calicophoron daubneyi TaxID=300641 RepID=A0AAV2T191_CALDB